MIDYTQPWQLGSLTLAHRLIQGPLAGYSTAAMRERFTSFVMPAYCVTEMLSAHDLVYKHQSQGRYLYRSPQEGYLAYQLSGNDPQILALAAKRCQDLGADLIDLNCGCPKAKIKKKGAGSALLAQQDLLSQIILAMKAAIHLPLTVKIRLTPQSPELIQTITESGADAIIIHARGPQDDYSKACDYRACRALKQLTKLPMIINGDIKDEASLKLALEESQADAAMIARAGCGQPWIYQSLLTKKSYPQSAIEQANLLIEHLDTLIQLEGEYSALLQARSLLRYYLRQQQHLINYSALKNINTLSALKAYLGQLIPSFSQNQAEILSDKDCSAT